MGRKLVVPTLLLGVIGVVMIYSASQVWAEYKNGSEYYYLIRQSIFFAIGVCFFFIFARLDYHILEKRSRYIFFVALLLLILVLIPGIGVVRGGARSWIGFNQLSVQPSEVMKVALIIFGAKFLATEHQNMKKLSYLLAYMAVVGIVFLLIMLEPDFGTGFIIVLTMVVMLLIAGIKKRYLVYGMIGGVGAIAGMIISAPYRLARIFAYLDPWSDPLGAGFQIIQSLYAISPAGIFGVGLFKSRQKFFYLPEPQTDFIFAIIFEELGLIGGITILVIFLYFFYLGIVISLRAKDNFGRFLALGITANIFIQFFINVGVVIGLLPVTGVTLPFLSYGGTSLTINLIMAGILVNIGGGLTCTSYSRAEKH